MLRHHLNVTTASRTRQISYSTLFPFAMGYATLPVLLFLASWLHVVAAIALSAVCVGMFVTTLAPPRVPAHTFTCLFSARVPSRQQLPNQADERPQTLSLRTMAVLVLVALLWCILGGEGNIWYQNSDWEYRNAIFRDLITHDWPVYYQGGTAALCYYVGHWLPAAAVGKVLAACGLPMQEVWSLANRALLVWTAGGVVLVELLVILTLRPRDGRRMLLCVVLLVFFSTPDALGLMVTGNHEMALRSLHLEWWNGGSGQFSSLTTCLFWVFNQTVIPWICTLCLMLETSFCRYVPIWLCCFFVGPFPSIGLAIMMLVQGVTTLVTTMRHNGSAGPILRDVASIQNVLALPCIAVVCLFFLSNVAVGASSEMLAPNMLAYPFWLPTDASGLIGVLYLVIIEGLMLPLLLLYDDRRRLLIYTIMGTLVLCPIIRVGTAADFCMRASIPAILSLYLLCAERLIRPRATCRRQKVVVAALTAVLALGCLTPATELLRGALAVSVRGLHAVWFDKGTLDDPAADYTKDEINFVVAQPGQSTFFRYLAKPPDAPVRHP